MAIRGGIITPGNVTRYVHPSSACISIQAPSNSSRIVGSYSASTHLTCQIKRKLTDRMSFCKPMFIQTLRASYAAVTWEKKTLRKSCEINGAGGGNRTHGLGIMRPSLYHCATPALGNSLCYGFI